MSAVSETTVVRVGKPWSDEGRDDVLRWFRDGHDADFIARRLGRTTAAIKSLLGRNGVRPNVAAWPLPIKESIREKAGLGWRHTRIAMAVGYDVATVDLVVRRLGPIAPPMDIYLDRPILVRIPKRPLPAPIPQPIVEVAPEPAPPPPAFPSGRGITRRAKRVVALIAVVTGVPTHLILGRNKSPAVVLARQVSCYWLRRLGYSTSTVGRMLGRDHSTVVYATDAYIRRRAEAGRKLPPIIAAVAEPIR